jgi:hypothetical protein
MNTVDIEKLNQLIARTDISGNDKVRWLTDFIDGREFEQQENSYNEQEMFNLLMDFFLEKDRQYKLNPVCVAEWFNKFKKK